MTEPVPRLVVRCDAGREVGGGHLMRCLRLAEEFRSRGGEAIFVSVIDSDAMRARVRKSGFDLVPLTMSHPAPEDAERTIDFLRDYRPDWIVLDGYHFESPYQKEMQETGVRVLVMDDMAHLPRYHADIIVNQNLGAEDCTYACGGETRLLVGLRYALLREEFLRWRNWEREVPSFARRILITLGAGDPGNQAAEVLRAVARLAGNGVENLEVVVVIGPAGAQVGALRAVGDDLGLDVTVQEDPTDMSKLMAWADVAVSGGGSTCWELAFMGLPNLILVLADNQKGAAHHLEKAGVSRSLGWWEDVSESSLTAHLKELMEGHALRREMSRKGRTVLDGEGAARIVRAMRMSVNQPAWASTAPRRRGMEP
ncbi:MAG: UDP-2,4-diacetamido-2,4,6-trideoxy-beta-L-altropyranose hydrolase [Nitrospinota bacterium]|nr:UDP-2,4-diacetamido-2,4,6-trideoxy-beta-L-altropyranose hydrolase [Nitrospinota bacterium]HJM43297.1 UDP-2,4-diacetamido-2,4,6-trideoxy-beta-L-altropyranose hydrolase [Nitrospinota bacterium]